jgi:glycosyltransferase involved in cell wall biosynthesis
VDAAVRRQFADARLETFDRHSLRRQPVRSLVRLWTHRFDAAVLVAADLAQPRLRLTSSLLALTRARSRWRIDVLGGRERWSAPEHVLREGGPVLRHLLACGMALAAAEPLLHALDARIQTRTLLSARLTTAAAAAEHVDAPAAARAGQRQQRTRQTLARLRQVSGDKHARTSAPERLAAPTRVPETPNARPNEAPPPKRHGDAPRILYLRSQLWLGLAGGGSAAHTAGVIGGLADAGAEVQVVSSDQLVGVGAATRVIRPEVWFDGWRRELEDLAYNVGFTLGAWRAARAFKPDAIYQRHTAFNVSGAILSRLLGLPLVLEFNSSEVWKGRYWGGLRLERAAVLVEAINLRAADRIIVVSRVLCDELVARGLKQEQIVVNPNAVDTRAFRADDGGQQVRRQIGAASDIVVGFSGTFGAWHGIPTLARTLGLVLEARPNVRWLLLGDGPLRPLIDQALPSPRLAERVAQVGMRPHAEMPGYLTACDILVSPHGQQADGGEFFGSPTKLYEYMASGRPIAASNLGQIAEVLTDGESALLVPPDDAEALAAAVIRLVDDSCLRVRLGSAARAAAEARHTWRQNAERVLECLGAR